MSEKSRDRRADAAGRLRNGNGPYMDQLSRELEKLGLLPAQSPNVLRLADYRQYA